MRKGQTSIRDGIQDFLCPFTDMYITQGANGKYSHRGTMANDVRGLQPGVRYPYYAPCDVKCIKIYAPFGEARWQSLKPVRFSNGRIDYATFETVHDNNFNARVGMVVKQGQQLGNMGDNGKATGVHCHIQISQSKDSSFWKNKYGILTFNHEYDTDECYFVDGTNILNMKSANWKYIPKENPKPVEPSKPQIDEDKEKIKQLEERIQNQDKEMLKVKDELASHTEIYTALEDGDYIINLNENETLYIKKN